uniref:Ig-like domain-containing protein n=1 Tax=Sinocyclocheilus anshuiensis TaxID=1608454 RepID=A0A671MZX4_9TELE
PKKIPACAFFFFSYAICFEYVRRLVCNGMFLMLLSVYNLLDLFYLLFSQEMTQGNASLKLDKITLQDAGVYTCSVSTNTGSLKKSFGVKIAAFYSEPRLQFSLLNDGVNLLVTSDGGYPSPTLQWLMENSDITNQAQTHLMQDTHTGLYVVSPWDKTSGERSSSTRVRTFKNTILIQFLCTDKSERQGESAYRCHGCFTLIPVILLLLTVMSVLFLFITKREQTKLNGFTEVEHPSEIQIPNRKSSICL